MTWCVRNILNDNYPDLIPAIIIMWSNNHYHYPPHCWCLFVWSAHLPPYYNSSSSPTPPPHTKQAQVIEGNYWQRVKGKRHHRWSRRVPVGPSMIASLPQAGPGGGSQNEPAERPITTFGAIRFRYLSLYYMIGGIKWNVSLICQVPAYLSLLVFENAADDGKDNPIKIL